MRWIAAALAVVALAAAPSDAAAMTDRQKERLVECLIDETSRDDREVMARVMVQAIVRGEIKKADWANYVQAILDLCQRCGIDVADIISDEATFVEVINRYGATLVSDGMSNIVD